MKYIGNAFSPAMIKGDEGDVLIKITTISKKQYMNAREHSKSIVGHPEIAEIFDLPLNRESVYLGKGDILYIVLPERRQKTGEKVTDGAKYEFVPESEGYTYKQIQVLEQ